MVRLCFHDEHPDLLVEVFADLVDGVVENGAEHVNGVGGGRDCGGLGL